MVALPFRKFRHSKGDSNASSAVPETTIHHGDLDKSQLKSATKNRENSAVLSSLLLIVTVVLLIVVEVGSVSDRAVLRDIWFIKLNLSDVVPSSVADSAALNSIARRLGLHDFYQVGLWNFCEGYFSRGITKCSTPRALYWFNPAAIIRNDLLGGASLVLPAQLSNILHAVRTVSHWMFGLFLTGACLSFVMIFIAPLSVYSRWNAVAITVLTFLNALFITVASIMGTAMFVVMRNVFQDNQDVNIGAKVGIAMFSCMWVASAFAVLTFIIHMCLMCCCASRRDVKTGRKRGSEKAYEVLP